MKKIITVTGFAFATIAAIWGCGNQAGTASIAVMDTAAKVARGNYLVTSIGCDDCHSPKKMGPQGPELIPELRFSGFTSGNALPAIDVNQIKKGWVLFSPDFTASAGDWGVSFSANLTPDDTGIGNWQENQFIKAIREGKSKGLAGSRGLLPPMPWFHYKNLTDDDLKAIFAYLKTTRPVSNIPPAPIPFSDLK